MSTKKQKYVIGNWKLNPLTVKEAKDLATKTRKELKSKGVKVVVCPPVVFLNEVGQIVKKGPVSLGAQDIFWESKGAFTGNINAEMVKNVGATFTIIGHSEKRAQGDTDEIVSKKVLAAIKNGLTVVLCVGEKDRDAHGAYLTFLKEQLENSLKGVNRKFVDQVVIAYEPIWAIGEGKTAMTSHDVHQMVVFVRKYLIQIFGANAASNISILYGGSVDPENTGALVKEGEVDGLLVGRNSLDAKKFAEIIKAVAVSK